MAKTESNPVLEENRYFDRCVKLVDVPDWVEGLIAATAPDLLKNSLEVAIVATDPYSDLRLGGFLIASGGKVVYAFQSDVAIQEDLGFWKFAATNYFWLTPTIALRKRVAAAAGGEAKGQSFKLPSDAVSVEALIDAVLNPCKPEEKKPKKPKKLKVPEKAAVEDADQGTGDPAVVSVPDSAVTPEVTSPMQVVAQGAEPSPTEDAAEAALVGDKGKRVADLAIGESMSMF